MAPKYRGDSEDWLDSDGHSQEDSSKPKKKKTNEARSLDLPDSEANAVVAEIFPNLCRVVCDDSQLSLLCSYKRAQVVGNAKRVVRERSPVTVGDRVRIQQTGTNVGVIEGICKRKNCLSRVAPGREGGEIQHSLAANIDLLVIVASTERPEFSPGLIDRFIVAAESEQIPVLICISKIDLFSSEDNPLLVDPPWAMYRTLGYSVLEFSSYSKTGLDQLCLAVEGKTVVFCGQSGVGKTSLLRCLIGREIGKVGAVNEQTGKGRHTTTGAVLLEGSRDSQWIDTPGVREFGLMGVSPQALGHFFVEFKELECTRRNCQHGDESYCNAKALPRYASYRRIYETLEQKDRGT